MNITITGATGFLGGALANRLINETDHNIVACGRQVAIGKELQSRSSKVTFLAGDLADPAYVKKAISAADRVFHCGALSSPWGARPTFEAANIEGTRNVLKACTEHGTGRLIHVSSPSIYHRNKVDQPLNEDAPIEGPALNHYIATKRVAEKLVRDSNQKSITLRPRALFGPGDQTLFPRILRANQKGRFPLIGGHDPLMDCTYIENAVDALLLASEAPDEYEGKIYNITNDEPILRSELFTKLFEEVEMNFNPRIIPLTVAKALASLLELGSHGFTMGRVEPLLTRYTVDVLSSGQVLDVSRAQRELGYDPKISIHQGLEEFGSWWRGGNR
ncbi:NAD-dependent epimerase/dehydratase family protein [bacterium]|nr:NAD-dependent epimerase/dehydratase family protein [bacterium]